jgi:hypothetical protein
MEQDRARIRWAIAWVAMVVALGLHVADEALTGFLPLYNSVVESLRDRHAWFPAPTFTYEAWLGGLVLFIVVLFVLTPLALHGSRFLRVLSYLLGGVMLANATAHVVASFWLGGFAPGVYSSPVLFLAAAALLYTAARTRHDNR